MKEFPAPPSTPPESGATPTAPGSAAAPLSPLLAGNPPDPPLPDLWSMFFRDAVDDPIIGLQGWIHVNGKEIPFVTGDAGEVHDLPRTVDPIPVEVMRVAGGRKQVAEVKLTPITGGVVLTSPKVKHRGMTRVHELLDAPPLSAQGDWIREAMRAHIAASGATYTYRCPSDDWKEKCDWGHLKQLDRIKKQSVAQPQVGIGQMDIPVLGQGKTVQTRDPEGHPVTLLGVEAWDGQLALGPNEKWRPVLEEAMEIPEVKRTGIRIFALAALIDSEAGSVQITQVTEVPVLDADKHPVYDKKTHKPLTRKRIERIDLGWPEDRHNPNTRSDAAGLTQFIRSSWDLMAQNPRTQLAKYARERGWIAEREVLATEHVRTLHDPGLPQRLARLEAAREAHRHALVVYNEHAEKGHPKGYKPPPDPPRTKKCPFIERSCDYDNLMKLRDDGRMSILTAAESMVLNFGTLQSSGFAVSSITNPFEIAKLAYYLHFLGPGEGKTFALGTMTEERAGYLLRQQFVGNGERLQTYTHDLNTWMEALWKFVKYICDDNMERGFKRYCRPVPDPEELGRTVYRLINEIKS